MFASLPGSLSGYKIFPVLSQEFFWLRPASVLVNGLKIEYNTDSFFTEEGPQALQTQNETGRKDEVGWQLRKKYIQT